MRVVFLGAANSIHLQRWVNYFAEVGWETHVISYSKPLKGYSEEVSLHKLFYAKGTENMLEPLYRNVRVKRIKNLLAKIKPDIVHAHNLAKYGEYAYLSGFRPYVLTNWGLSDLKMVQYYLGFTTKKLEGKRYELRKMALQKASAITALVEHARCIIEKDFGVDPNNIHIFPWGIETEVFYRGYEEEVSALRKELEIEKDKKVILSPRTADPFYNIETIVKAFGKVVMKREDCVLIVLRGGGSEAHMERLRYIAKGEGMMESIRFVSDFIPFRNMPIYYNLSSVSVQIPKTDQGALSVHESMACGAVVVATDIEGNREMIRDGENGFLVDPNDLISVISSIEKALDQNFREKAYEINHQWIIENADWKKNSKRMADIYIASIRATK
ncbi:MAG: glycosyltransferase family 4 protein [Candidatus Thermoplasmatota archaeon]|nr:glycosyltransferase family 4 protein [Candidatus Thermoplasmatota archaeon]